MMTTWLFKAEIENATEILSGDKQYNIRKLRIWPKYLDISLTETEFILIFIYVTIPFEPHRKHIISPL
jgi:hypothetical protein